MTPQEQTISHPAPHKHRRIPYTYADDGTKLKVCTDCLVPKTLDSYSKSKGSRDGIYPSCKLCCKKYNEVYHLRNKEKANQYSKEWGEKNKKRIAERNKVYLDEYMESVRNGNPERFKICTRCKGEPQPFSAFPINLGHRDGHGSQCRKCMNEHIADWYYRNKDSISQAGREQRKDTWAKRHVKASKQSATRKNVPFDLTAIDFYDPVTGCLPDRCPIFPSVILDYEAGPNRRNWASVDRIVPELGYVKGNVCIISYGANTWKSNGSSPEERLVIMQIIARSRQSKGAVTPSNEEQGSLFAV